MSRNLAEWQATPALPHTHFVDNTVYTDESLFREEQTKIYGSVWKFVCHEGEIPDPNDFRTSQVAGQPLVIARGVDGKVRTFINSCSHRGTVVVTEPSGNAKFWTCVFHRWVYDNQGACIAIPRDEAYQHCAFDKSNVGLREVRTEVRLGLVFVNLDDNSEPLDEFLGDALTPLETVLSKQPLEPFHYHRCTMDSNWKLWQLTNIEPYHEFMHVINRKTQFSQKDVFKRKIDCLPNGHINVGSFKPDYSKGDDRSTDDVRMKPLPGLDPDEWIIVDLFPDVMINVRTTVVRIDTQIPLSPTKTLLEFRGLGIKDEPPEDRAMRIRHHNDYWGPFGRNLPEDNRGIELQMMAMNGNAIPYSIHAREEGGTGQDDVPVRAFFEEWGRLMGRDPANPFDTVPENHAL